MAAVICNEDMPGQQVFGFALAGVDLPRESRTSSKTSAACRRLPVPQLAPGLSVYQRPRMAEEGLPENAEVV